MWGDTGTLGQEGDRRWAHRGCMVLREGLEICPPCRAQREGWSLLFLHGGGGGWDTECSGLGLAYRDRAAGLSNASFGDVPQQEGLAQQQAHGRDRQDQTSHRGRGQCPFIPSDTGSQAGDSGTHRETATQTEHHGCTGSNTQWTRAQSTDRRAGSPFRKHRHGA